MHRAEGLSGYRFYFALLLVLNLLNYHFFNFPCAPFILPSFCTLHYAALCSLPYALCSMLLSAICSLLLYALCSMLYALCSFPPPKRVNLKSSQIQHPVHNCEAYLIDCIRSIIKGWNSRTYDRSGFRQLSHIVDMN